MEIQSLEWRKLQSEAAPHWALIIELGVRGYRFRGQLTLYTSMILADAVCFNVYLYKSVVLTVRSPVQFVKDSVYSELEQLNHSHVSAVLLPPPSTHRPWSCPEEQRVSVQLTVLWTDDDARVVIWSIWLISGSSVDLCRVAWGETLDRRRLDTANSCTERIQQQTYRCEGSCARGNPDPWSHV